MSGKWSFLKNDSFTLRENVGKVVILKSTKTKRIHSAFNDNFQLKNKVTPFILMEENLIDFNGSYEELCQVISGASGLVVEIFIAPWCPPCRKLNEMLPNLT